MVLHTTFITERYGVLIKALDDPEIIAEEEIPTIDEGVPEPMFVFVNRAKFWTRHNLDITGTIVSSAFDAATGAMPIGSVRNWFRSALPQDSSMLRTMYINGTLDYLPFEWNPRFLGSTNPFTMGTIDDYRVEYDAEISRRLVDSTAPSRLSAIYAFADRDTCEAVSKAHGWDLSNVQEFRLEPHPLNRVRRVNMGIVSLMRFAYSQGGMWSRPELEKIWGAYWEGLDRVVVEMARNGRDFESFESGCIWEYLVEGKLVRV